MAISIIVNPRPRMLRVWAMGQRRIPGILISLSQWKALGRLDWASLDRNFGMDEGQRQEQRPVSSFLEYPLNLKMPGR